MTLRIAIVKGVIPSYSEGFYKRLFARPDLSVRVFCQDHIRGLNLKTIHGKYPHHVTLVKFVSLNLEKASWQFLPWRKIMNEYDVVFVQGNPRNLSHFALATYLRFTGRRVVLWTMGHSFRGNSLTENIRLLWSRLFRFVLLYTDAEEAYLLRKGFRRHVMFGQNNGLDQKEIDAAAKRWPADRLSAWRSERGLINRNVLLSCARIDPKNRYAQVIEALPEIVKSIPGALWCVIGTGVEEERLRGMVADAGLTDHVRFVGELYRQEDLAPWFLSSTLFVHPAAIGLSLLHAFGYGLPVVTHGNAERQNPEFAAFENGKTGRTFPENDVGALASAVIGLAHDATGRTAMKQAVLRIVREEYNVDVMVDRFIRIARLAMNDREGEPDRRAASTT